DAAGRRLAIFLQELPEQAGGTFRVAVAVSEERQVEQSGEPEAPVLVTVGVQILFPCVREQPFLAELFAPVHVGAGRSPECHQEKRGPESSMTHSESSF